MSKIITRLRNRDKPTKFGIAGFIFGIFLIIFFFLQFAYPRDFILVKIFDVSFVPTRKIIDIISSSIECEGLDCLGVGFLAIIFAFILTPFIYATAGYSIGKLIEKIENFYKTKKSFRR